MLKAINHVQVSIPKGAEEQARQFYCQTLGLHETPKPNALAGRGGFWAELNGVQVHFGAEEGINREATRAHVAYEVDDLSQWRQRLTVEGITVIEGSPIPGVVRFEFRDPFGNRIEFLQRTDTPVNVRKVGHEL